MQIPFLNLLPIANHCRLFIQVLFISVGATHIIFRVSFSTFFLEPSKFYWYQRNYRDWDMAQ